MKNLIFKIILVVGILLLTLGLVVYGIFPYIIGGPITAILGAIMIGSYVYVNWREIKDSISVRSAKYGTNTTIFVIVILLICCLIYVLSERIRYRMDTAASFTTHLSKQTIDIISKLDDPIEVFGFITKQDIPMRSTFRGLCDFYSYHSKGKISCKLVDPDEHPALSRSFRVGADNLYGFRSGKKTAKTNYLLEEDFTSAIIRLTRNIKKKVYFVTGHGEGDIKSDSDYNFKKVASKLNNNGYNAIELFLPQVQEIPRDCSVLVLLSPKTAFRNSEIEKINNYLEKGGSVFVMIDPFNNANLDSFLDEWGLVAENNAVVVDVSSNLERNSITPLIEHYAEHPITKVKAGRLPQTFFKEAMPLRLSPKKYPTLKRISLFATGGGSKYSWGETDIELYKNEGKVGLHPDVDLQGPLFLAFAVSKNIVEPEDKTKENPDLEKVKTKEQKRKEKEDTKEAKLVVIGDSDFANNLSLDFSGNSTLFMNIISWMAGDDELITIQRPPLKPNLIKLTNNTRKLFYLLFLLLIPGVILLNGAIIWWKKRN